MNNSQRQTLRAALETIGAVVVGMVLFYAMLQVAAMLEFAAGW